MPDVLDQILTMYIAHRQWHAALLQRRLAIRKQTSKHLANPIHKLNMVELLCKEKRPPILVLHFYQEKSRQRCMSHGGGILPDKTLKKPDDKRIFSIKASCIGN